MAMTSAVRCQARHEIGRATAWLGSGFLRNELNGIAYARFSDDHFPMNMMLVRIGMPGIVIAADMKPSEYNTRR